MAQDVIINGTTYPAVKSVALMGANGKAVQYYPDAASLAYATCDTVAATAAKVVTVSGNENWELKIGSVIMVYFSASNSASNVTLDVNGTGAYPIWYNNAEYTSTGTAYTGYAKRVIEYMFNGTHWVWMGSSYDANTTYKNVALGHGYATCSTAAATAAKVGTLSSYALTVGGIVAVKFTNAVPANATLNINSKGAKNMFFRGAKITAGVIKAGDIATFIYDGTQYQLLSVDRWQNDVVALQNTLNGLSLGIHTDGLVYLFANGSPVGTGIELPSGGIDGYIDSENNIVFRNLPDGTWYVKYEKENGDTVNIGNLVLDSNVYYTVTKNLTNCTISNSATQAIGGKSYSATITAASGYELKSVSVTMGGQSVSVSGGKINISNVTGNIVITAVAEASSPTYTNKFVLDGDGYILNGRTSSTGADRTDSPGCFVSNYIKVSNGDTIYTNIGVSNAYSGFKLSDGTTTAAMIPTDTTKITNYSVTNGITKFTINVANVEYVRVTLYLNSTGTQSITNTDVENAGVIITVNEPIV
jgi:hypothetical protein